MMRKVFLNTCTIIASMLVVCACGGNVKTTGNASDLNNAEESEHSLFPKVTKVVMLNESLNAEDEGVSLLKAPQEGAPLIMVGTEGPAPYPAKVFCHTNFPVLAEENGYYKIAVPFSGFTEGYLPASLCTEVPTTGEAAISENTVYTEWVNPNFECGGGAWVVHRKDGQRFVTMYTEIACDANTLQLGVYQNGFYLFGYSVYVTDLHYDESKTGFSLKKSSPDDYFFEGYYGSDMVIRHTTDEGNVWLELDWAKVPEQALTDIFKETIDKGERSLTVLTAADIYNYQHQTADYEEEEEYGD